MFWLFSIFPERSQKSRKKLSMLCNRVTLYMVSRKLVQRTNAWLNRVEFFYTYSWVNGLCFGYFRFFLSALKKIRKKPVHLLLGNTSYLILICLYCDLNVLQP